MHLTRLALPVIPAPSVPGTLLGEPARGSMATHYAVGGTLNAYESTVHCTLVDGQQTVEGCVGSLLLELMMRGVVGSTNGWHRWVSYGTMGLRFFNIVLGSRGILIVGWSSPPALIGPPCPTRRNSLHSCTNNNRAC